ncbi:hypothetical protein [Endozoicomonas sp. ONNA2]|uniref:hypothetical protein n=1 Tax=Endozoicomonas sp. ONNA2 TaxID=2828741 RepID=UPI0021489BE1|nr:hypothetical protein [Endozoicomonas sp. ONNA2]
MVNYLILALKITLGKNSSTAGQWDRHQKYISAEQVGLNGPGVKQNYDEALTGFYKAADRGNATAQNNLDRLGTTGNEFGQGNRENCTS